MEMLCGALLGTILNHILVENLSYSKLKDFPFKISVSSNGVGLDTAALTQHPFFALRNIAATLAGALGDSISYLVSTLGAPAWMVSANTEPVILK